MKKSRDEIADSIEKRKLIFFESVPLNFNEFTTEEELNEMDSPSETHSQRKSLWSVISDQILDPQKKMEELLRALEKIFELNEYEKSVFKAFATGKKPPLKFSDKE